MCFRGARHRAVPRERGNMRHVRRQAILAIALGFVFAATAAADTLHMKDGRVLQGRYLGGTQTSLRFEMNGEVRTFAVADVASVTFTRGAAQDNSAPDSSQPNANPPDADGPPTDASSPNNPQPLVSQDTIPPGSNPPTDAPPSAPRPAAYSGPPAQPVPGQGTSTQVTIPAGQSLLVRMIDGVDSSKNRVGDIFHASLETDLYSSGVFVARKGTDVYGRLAEAKGAGHFSGSSELQLELTQIVIDGRDYPLVSSDYEAKGKGRGSDTAKKVGGGAVVGAIIGAIAGGGKGAAIGAGAGSAAGAGVQILTRGQQVKVPSETLLEFRLEQPAVVMPTQR